VLHCQCCLRQPYGGGNRNSPWVQRCIPAYQSAGTSSGRPLLQGQPASRRVHNQALPPEASGEGWACTCCGHGHHGRQHFCSPEDSYISVVGAGFSGSGYMDNEAARQSTTAHPTVKLHKSDRRRWVCLQPPRRGYPSPVQSPMNEAATKPRSPDEIAWTYLACVVRRRGK
jgi:hypothetical protein